MRLQSVPIVKCTSAARSAYPRTARLDASARDLQPTLIRPSEPKGRGTALAPRLNASEKALLDSNFLQPTANPPSPSKDDDLRRRNLRVQEQFNTISATCTVMAINTVA